MDNNDNNKKFSKALFGFSKKSVTSYIVNLTTELSQKISELEDKVKDYEKSISEKDEKIARLEAERAHVAETLLKARVEYDELITSANAKAEEILSDAKTSADTITSNAKEESENIVLEASIQAETLISNSKEEANLLKTASEKELADLENQKNYVSQCISSLKLDVLSAYEVYMLKLEKSMGQNDAIPLDESCIEVEHNHVGEAESENSEPEVSDAKNETSNEDTYEF